MADTDFGAFADRAHALDTDVMLVMDASGAGINVPMSAIVKRNSAGLVTIGPTSAIFGAHTLAHAAAQGSVVATFYSTTTNYQSVQFYATGNDSFNGNATGMNVGRNTTTNRGISTPGTINANGADMAEYKRKAPGCGRISKGDVCGVTTGNELTTSWADSIDFVVKTWRPHTVGGDTWGNADSVTPDGQRIGAQPVQPERPERPDDDLTDADAASEAWTAANARYLADLAAWRAVNARYLADLAAWTTRHEAARLNVDRIAIAGQVPINITGPFAPGDFVVAMPDGDGIEAVAYAPADFVALDPLVQLRKVGRVWGVTEEFRETIDGIDTLVWPAGLAWCAVSVG